MGFVCTYYYTFLIFCREVRPWAGGVACFHYTKYILVFSSFVCLSVCLSVCPSVCPSTIWYPLFLLMSTGHTSSRNNLIFGMEVYYGIVKKSVSFLMWVEAMLPW